VSEVPAPKLSDPNLHDLRSIFLLFGRGLIYALAFWTVYRVMLIVYPVNGGSTDSEERARELQSSQAKTYDEQVKRSNQMFDASEAQQTRMLALISKQDEQAKRFDAVLDQWERQTGLRK